MRIFYRFLLLHISYCESYVSDNEIVLDIAMWKFNGFAFCCIVEIQCDDWFPLLT